MHWSSPLSVLDLGLRWVSRLIVAWKGVDLLQELRNHPSAGEKTDGDTATVMNIRSESLTRTPDSMGYTLNLLA